MPLSQFPHRQKRSNLKNGRYHSFDCHSGKVLSNA